MILAELDDALTKAAEHGFGARLVEDWSISVDAAMLARLESLDLAAMGISARIRTAVLTRLELLKPHKKAARRASLFLAQPWQAPLAMRLLARTADRMWRAAGDPSVDINWYSKRASLAAIYAATEIAWFGDDTPDASGTAAFLDARIENLRQYEKLKARVRKACQPSTTRTP